MSCPESHRKKPALHLAPEGRAPRPPTRGTSSAPWTSHSNSHLESRHGINLCTGQGEKVGVLSFPHPFTSSGSLTTQENGVAFLKDFLAEKKIFFSRPHDTRVDVAACEVEGLGTEGSGFPAELLRAAGTSSEGTRALSEEVCPRVQRRRAVH